MLTENALRHRSATRSKPSAKFQARFTKQWPAPRHGFVNHGWWGGDAAVSSRWHVPGYWNVGHFKAEAAGTFLVTADRTGYRYSPLTKEGEELWTTTSKDTDPSMDFDPESLVGVWTNFRLVTKVIDLRTGVVRFTVDNSANYKEELISWSSTGRDIIPWAVVGAGCLSAVVVLWRVLLKARRHALPRSKP